MNELNPLLGKEVTLFDESGGLLDENGDYLTNWWDIGTLILISFRKKYLFVKNTETNKTGKIKTGRIINVYKNELILSDK